MLILPHDHRAPFIAPGRRNRKVHWNRPLSRAINSLGKFEKEDWRRALWLPESLRQFYPRWNNQFAPGGGSGCGCCDPSGDCTTDPECYDSATDAEVEVPDVFTSNGARCTECADFGGTYILSETSPGTFRYAHDNDFCTEEPVNSDFQLVLVVGCSPSFRCVYTLLVNLASLICQSTFNYVFSDGGSPVSLPIELPYDSQSTASTHCCNRSNTDPAYVTGFA